MGWETASGAIVGVEGFVLSHYTLSHYTAPSAVWSQGVHLENGLFLSCFTLLLWESIFAPRAHHAASPTHRSALCRHPPPLTKPTTTARRPPSTLFTTHARRSQLPPSSALAHLVAQSAVSLAAARRMRRTTCLRGAGLSTAAGAPPSTRRSWASAGARPALGWRVLARSTAASRQLACSGRHSTCRCCRCDATHTRTSARTHASHRHTYAHSHSHASAHTRAHEQGPVRPLSPTIPPPCPARLPLAAGGGGGAWRVCSRCHLPDPRPRLRRHVSRGARPAASLARAACASALRRGQGPGRLAARCAARMDRRARQGGRRGRGRPRTLLKTAKTECLCDDDQAS